MKFQIFMKKTSSFNLGYVAHSVYPERDLLPMEFKGNFNKFLNNLDIKSNDTIVVYTLSDHILNLIRFFISKNKIENSTVYYSCPIKNEVIKVGIKSNGYFDYNGKNGFPKGFYDATLEEIYQIS